MRDSHSGLIAAVFVVVLSGCFAGPRQPQPVGPDHGIQLSGRLGGVGVNISDGDPQVLLGDCDPGDGRDEDLCISSRTIAGSPLGLVIENPRVFVPGATVRPADPRRLGCLPYCDEVRGGRVVIEVRADGDQQFVVGGRLTVRQAGPRYAAGFILRLHGGTLTGQFNVGPGTAG